MDNHSMKTNVIIGVLLVLLCSLAIAGCSTRRVNGWYPIADYPRNDIEGKAIITVNDFAESSLDSVSFPGTIFIWVRLKPNKTQKWVEATEHRIGKRIGFVFNDSVVMAPRVNCRIDGGECTIISEDENLIKETFKSLNKGKWDWNNENYYIGQ